MSQIPKESEALIDPRTGRLSRAWRQFFGNLGTSAQTVNQITQIIQGTQPGSTALSDIASLTTAGYLVNAGGTIVARSMAEGEGITITNAAATAGPTTFSLALFDDTGAGDGLWKFTRDEFGRVEGTQQASAEDLPYNDSLLSMGVTDVQAALDMTLGAVALPSDTAPDPAEHTRWLDTTTMTEYLWYDDGTSAQWVDVGGGGGVSADGVLYDNTTSGLTATDVQAALDEIVVAVGTAGDVAGDTHAATSKNPPVDADEIPLADSAASFVLKKLTWANVKATMWAAWGALINAGTGKTTPVDADALAIMDSAASNATKKLTWANLKATLKTYFDGIYSPVGGGYGEGTSFPGSPSTNQKFFRNDLGLLCYYDGTRWLTANVYSMDTATSNATIAGMSNTAVAARLAVRQDYGIYLTRWVVTVGVAGVNNGSNFWTVTLDRFSATNVSTNIASTSTVADPGSGNWANHDQTINAVLDASARELAITNTKTGASTGAIFFAYSLHYRLVIT